ncbi:hypothetical protein SD78_0725 [Bacillus badius]|nr:hypothetical protein SD78_0725 [Bacillus badius]
MVGPTPFSSFLIGRINGKRRIGYDFSKLLLSRLGGQV